MEKNNEMEMTKAIYGQAVATECRQIWCHNCNEDLTHYKGRFIAPLDVLTIRNTNGITVHRCSKAEVS